jgi:hypothetical protein
MGQLKKMEGRIGEKTRVAVQRGKVEGPCLALKKRIKQRWRRIVLEKDEGIV